MLRSLQADQYCDAIPDKDKEILFISSDGIFRWLVGVDLTLVAVKYQYFYILLRICDPIE